MKIDYQFPQPGHYGQAAAPQVAITALCHPWLIEHLQQQYYIHYQPAITYAELAQLAPHLHGLVVTTRLPIDAALIDAAPLLQWIGRLGSGLELIDVAYAQAKGIEVASSPEGNAPAVAEHVLGMLLSVLRHIAHGHRQVAEGTWQRDANRGFELRGATVGIVGYGHTGSAFARLLAPFDVTVLACDPYKYGFAQGYIKEAALEQLQRYADVISFHVPLTAETREMANADFFAACTQQPVILNASRGKVLQLAHLRQALELGMVSGAALDVLPNEQLATYTNEEKEMLHWLGSRQNVVLTPHIAGYSHQALLNMAKVLVAKLGLCK